MIEQAVHPELAAPPAASVSANDPRIQRANPLEPIVAPTPLIVPEGQVVVGRIELPEVAHSEPVVAHTEPEVAHTPELPELRYEWQPTDEHDRPMGGKQVIKYKTPEEFQQKMTEINVNLQRELRKVTRKQRLGIVDTVLPTTAAKAPETPTFERKPMSAEERFELTQQLANPETCEAARDRLLESAGYSDLQKTVVELREKYKQQEAYTNFQIFVHQNPEFYPDQENVELLCDWVLKNGLDTTVANFGLAYSVAKEAGLLLSPPTVREETPAVVLPQPVAAVVETVAPEQTVPESPAPVAQAARIDEPEHSTKSQARVPSGLNSRVASNTGVVEDTSEKPAFTLAQIERMSSDEFKRRVNSMPGFTQLVEKLEKEKREKQPR